jgi:hypothetical protein
LPRIQSIDIRLFLEGVEIPARPTGAALAVAPNQPLQFQVLLPPVDFDVVKRLRPRTHAVVFYRTGSDGTDDPKEWKIWAEGEYVGYGFTKQAAGSMATVLHFAGLENYWQTVYALHFQTVKSAAATAYSDAELVFGTGTKIVTVSGNEDRNPIPLEQQIANQLGLNPNDLRFPEFYVQLLKKSIETNAFLKNADARLRLNDRVVAVADDDIQKLVKVNNLTTMITGAFSQHPPDAKLLDILAQLMSLVYYGYQIVPFPPFLDGKLNTFWMKPDVPFAAPPRCNVIFPGSIDSISFGRSYLNEPTRLRLSLQAVATGEADKLTRIMHYAPFQLQTLADKIAHEQDPAKRNYEDLVMSDPTMPEESREDIKGVIPAIAVLQQFEAVMMSGASDAERNTYYSGLAQYELLLAQHSARTMRVTGRFMPNLVCGLPGVVIMQHGVILGTVDDVQHQIAADGAPATAVTLSYCRETDLSNLQSPIWKNQAFVDQKKVDATYESLFGVKSILAPAPSVDSTLNIQFKDQMVAAKAIRETYLGSPDRNDFEERYTARPSASEEDVFRFLKASKNGRDYGGPNLRGDWVAEARVFAQALQSQIQDAT